MKSMVVSSRGKSIEDLCILTFSRSVELICLTNLIFDVFGTASMKVNFLVIIIGILQKSQSWRLCLCCWLTVLCLMTQLISIGVHDWFFGCFSACYLVLLSLVWVSLVARCQARGPWGEREQPEERDEREEEKPHRLFPAIR